MNTNVKDIIFWIEKNLVENLSIDTVCRKSGYSKWYFQRLFKRETGISLATYLRKRRVTEAARALKMTKNTLLDISEMFNFSSQQAFTRVFTKHFGISPLQFRNSDTWDFSLFQPNLNLPSGNCSGKKISEISLLEAELVTLHYDCKIENLLDPVYHAVEKEKLFKKLSDNWPSRQVDYFFESFKPSDHFNIITFFLNFSLISKQKKYASLTRLKYLYHSYDFNGKIDDFVKMQNDIYNHEMIKNSYSRLSFSDIFVFNFPVSVLDLSSNFSGYYLIPVKTKN